MSRKFRLVIEMIISLRNSVISTGYHSLLGKAYFGSQLEISVSLKGLFIATHLTSPVIVNAVSFANICE